MGKTYIKEENGEKVLYEEDFFGDIKLGNLHKNWDGSLETFNFFGDNYKLKEESSLIQITKPDYQVETESGKSGTLKWDSWNRRHETELKSNSTKSPSVSQSSYNGNSYNEDSYKGGNSKFNNGRQNFNSPKKENKNNNLEEIANKNKKNVSYNRENIFYVSCFTTPEAMEKASKSFAKFVYIPTSLLLTYKCDRCGHEWDSSMGETRDIPEETVRCIMGCSDEGPLFGLYKLFESLFTRKTPYGYGRLIKTEKMDQEFLKRISN